MNKVSYLREVLGIKNYLCPSSVQKIRILEGEIPAKILVIVSEVLNDSDKQLLKKILSSVNFHEYSLLQLIDSSYQKTFVLESLELAQLILVFGVKEEMEKQKNLFQTSYSLKELNKKETSTIEKKKQLWGELLLWEKNSKRF